MRLLCLKWLAPPTFVYPPDGEERLLEDPMERKIELAGSKFILKLDFCALKFTFVGNYFSVIFVAQSSPVLPRLPSISLLIVLLLWCRCTQTALRWRLLGDWARVWAWMPSRSSSTRSLLCAPVEVDVLGQNAIIKSFTSRLLLMHLFSFLLSLCRALKIIAGELASWLAGAILLSIVFVLTF